MSQWSFRFSGLIVMITAACMISCAMGCSGGSDGPELAEVTGTVTMDGNPLPKAAVEFKPASTKGEALRTALGMTDDEGNYSLEYSISREGAAPGKYKVSISTFREPDEDEDGEPIPGSKETVPAKYNSKTTLEKEVTIGGGPYDFSLKSGGEVIQPTAEEGCDCQ